nr:putative chemosensory protein 2 [Corcyra cephalonica]
MHVMPYEIKPTSLGFIPSIPVFTVFINLISKNKNSIFHKIKFHKIKFNLNYRFKMRIFIILGILMAATVNAFDYTKYLKDETKFRAAIDCLLDKAPCGELQELRDTFPRLVATECGSCTPEEKTKYEIVKKTLQDHYPDDFEALKAKYLPRS